MKWYLKQIYYIIIVLFYFILLKIKHPHMWHQFTFISLFVTIKLGLLSPELGLFSSSSVSAASPASSTTPVTSCNYRIRHGTSANVLKSEIIWVQTHDACLYCVLWITSALFASVHGLLLILDDFLQHLHLGVSLKYLPLNNMVFNLRVLPSLSLADFLQGILGVWVKQDSALRSISKTKLMEDILKVLI